MGYVIDEKGPHLTWEKKCDYYEAYNQEGDCVGYLHLRNWGRHTHWTWRQEDDTDMSPGCLEEVRKKQKELFKNRKKG